MSIEVVWSIEEFLLILPDTCLKTQVHVFKPAFQLRIHFFFALNDIFLNIKLLFRVSYYVS